MRNMFRVFSQFERSVLLYMGLWCAVGFGYFGIVGVLLNLYVIRMGYGTEFVGLLNGSGQLVWALFSIPAVRIGARFGLKRALVAGMVLIALGTILLVAAGSLPQNVRTAGLMVAWMISWVGASLMTVNSAPYLMAITQPESRGLAFSIQQSTLAFTAVIGSLVAGLLPATLARWLGTTLDQPDAYRLALLLAPVAYLAGGLAVSRVHPVSNVLQTANASAPLRAPQGFLLFLGIFIVLQVFCEGALRAFFNVYLDTNLGVSTARIGAVMGFSQLLPVVFALMTPLILSRFGCQRTLIILSMAATAFMLLLAGLPNATAATVSFMAMAGISTMMATARTIFSQESVGLQWRATASAAGTIGVAIGWASASVMGGILASTLGLRTVFFAGAVFSLLAAGLMATWAYAHRQQPVSESFPEPNLPATPAIPVSGKAGDD